MWNFRTRRQKNGFRPIELSHGYGLLWHNPGMGHLGLGRTQTRWVADASRLTDYVIMTGDGYPGSMERYADLTGHAPMPPEWAAGF